MRPRELTILCGALALSAAAGIAFLSQETFAVELPPPGTTAPLEPTPGTDPDAAAAKAVAVDAAHRGDAAPAAAVAATSDALPRVDTAGWTKGIIRGDIQLAVAALEQLKSISIIVEEQRNPVGENHQMQRPVRIVVPVKRGIGTPTFEVTDVPFSDYPYVVSVYAEGLNGGRRTVTIDKSTPLVDNLVLAITPGSPYSVLIRDQDGQPYANIDVRMLPIGEPLGRPRQTGLTDNFGGVVFPSVLAGDYQLFLSQSGQLLAEVKTVTVQAIVRARNAAAQGQSHNAVIPRGIPVELSVHDAAGYAVVGATVTAIATDRVRLTEIKAPETDGTGRTKFPHLQPGIWHVQIEKPDFQRTDLQLTLQPGQEPQYREIRLVRTRF